MNCIDWANMMMEATVSELLGTIPDGERDKYRALLSEKKKDIEDHIQSYCETAAREIIGEMLQSVNTLTDTQMISELTDYTGACPLRIKVIISELLNQSRQHDQEASLYHQIILNEFGSITAEKLVAAARERNLLEAAIIDGAVKETYYPDMIWDGEKWTWHKDGKWDEKVCSG